MTGHDRDVAAISFSPDGTYLASGGNDTTVRLWEVDVERAAARLCERHPAPLTPQQWAEHFPKRCPTGRSAGRAPFRATCREVRPDQRPPWEPTARSRTTPGTRPRCRPGTAC
ncbi:WD40 repeat domain-containing protein [Lentzea flava]|uniref:WD40 repeat domain-containing protein n=1 Tax=Lentzea flava TaxID=103732 RepID=UPI0034D4F096